MSDFRQDAVTEALKATPPVAVIGAGLADLGPVALATILYIVLQAAYLAWKWFHEVRDRRAKNVGRSEGDRRE